MVQAEKKSFSYAFTFTAESRENVTLVVDSFYQHSRVLIQSLGFNKGQSLAFTHSGAHWMLMLALTDFEIAHSPASVLI